MKEDTLAFIFVGVLMVVFLMLSVALTPVEAHCYAPTGPTYEIVDCHD